MKKYENTAMTFETDYRRKTKNIGHQETISWKSWKYLKHQEKDMIRYKSNANDDIR